MLLTRHYKLAQGVRWECPDASAPLPPCPSLLGRNPSRELFVRGRSEAFELLEELPARGLAVVGTRRPQARSLALVRSRLHAVRDFRLIVLSGLALGIDAAAHEQALGAGLPTIAVLGGALDDIYPRQNRQLARDILDHGGLLVSERPPGTRLQRGFFIQRNRLIAGWARATWVVEAPHRSGALNTAMYSRDLDRDTYATPCFPGDPAFAGTQKLIEEKKAFALWDAYDFAETWSELRSAGRPAKAPAPLNGELFPDASLLVARIALLSAEYGGARVDDLLEWAFASGWEPQRLFAALQQAVKERWVHDLDGVLTPIVTMNA